MRTPFGWTMAGLLALALAAPAARAGQAAPDSLERRPTTSAWSSGPLRPDRLQHASLGFTLGLGTGLASRRPGLAVGVSFGLGAAKEARDARTGGRFDLGDLAADAFGAVLAAVLTRALD